MELLSCNMKRDFINDCHKEIQNETE
jgi:hypothetical protein